MGCVWPDVPYAPIPNAIGVLVRSDFPASKHAKFRCNISGAADLPGLPAAALQFGSDPHRKIYVSTDSRPPDMGVVTP